MWRGSGSCALGLGVSDGLLSKASPEGGADGLRHGTYCIALCGTRAMTVMARGSGGLLVWARCSGAGGEDDAHSAD